MGLDIGVYTARNKQELLTDKYWQSLPTNWVKISDPDSEDEEIDYSVPCQVYYARKFWDLYTPMCQRLNLGNGEFGELNKTDVEFMLEIATHTRDYFGTFNTVIRLCEILDRWDEVEEAGLKFFFEGDY